MKLLPVGTHSPLIRKCLPTKSTYCQLIPKNSSDLGRYLTRKIYQTNSSKVRQTEILKKTGFAINYKGYQYSARRFSSKTSVGHFNSHFRRKQKSLYHWTSVASLFPSHRLHNVITFRSYQSSSSIYLRPGEKWQPGAIPLLDEYTSRLDEIEDRLFDYLGDHTGKVQISHFINALTSTGLRESDPRLREFMQALTRYQSSGKWEDAEYSRYGPTLDREAFKECVSRNIVLIASAFRNHFIIPDFSRFCQDTDQLYWQARENIGGKVATYIPQLARYSPNYWGVSVCSVDGQRYSVGDTNVPFCLQSISKPLTYAMVLDDLSPKVVHEYVGHEPSGVAFNTISLDYRDKPHNPMVNAGAIVACSLLKQTYNLADRFDYVSNVLKRLTGGEYLAFNNSVFLSERETADRNFALGFYMREKKCFPEGCNLMEVMDFYFQLCSLEVTCDSGAVMAATLANGGICPITGDKVLSSSSVRDTMSLMLTCGMYDYSGEFAFKVGLPAKSGVAGGIMIVVPNKMGFFVWSPALDKWGNSVRGVQFAKDLVGKFNFHHYDNMKFTPKKTDPCQKKIESRATDVVNLLFSAFNSDVSALRRYALSDHDMDQSDYDGRTALHIGAAEGHESVVRFLLHKCKCNPFVVDRWGFTPLDDAKRFGQDIVAKLLEDAMEKYNASVKIDRRFEAIDSTKYGEITFKVDHTLNTAERMKLDDGVKYVDDTDDIYNLVCTDDKIGEHILLENQTKTDSENSQSGANVDKVVEKNMDEIGVHKEFSGKDQNVDEINEDSTNKNDNNKIL